MRRREAEVVTPPIHHEEALTAQARVTAFDQLGIRDEILRAVADMGFEKPRPIQAAALPPGLEGRDILGLARTGTGKTAAFAITILQALLKSPGRGGTQALVLAPTRDLAKQVHEQIESLAAHTRLRSALVVGGVPISRQAKSLRPAPEILVACPGRLLDLASQRLVALDRVSVLVLDEADHMFDMGFLPDVHRILKMLPAQRQNLFFSATMPKEVRKLVESHLRNPARIELTDSRPATTIDHSVCPMAELEKLSALQDLLGDRAVGSAIVFLRTKHRAKRIAQRLANSGFRAVAMQGNMSQSQRERALAGFRAGHYKVLVATDIAARGLDFEAVSHVINFDVPMTPEAYTHRIGRTGRSERSGIALTFVTPEDKQQLRAIERHLGSPIRATSLRHAYGS